MVEYTGIGVCTTVGARNAGIIGVVLGGAVGGVLSYAYAKQHAIDAEEEFDLNEVTPIIIGVSLVGCAIGGAALYFTCKGIEHGIPITQR